ncbi:beta-galactosidase [Kineococcus sp. SYSU DK005]|uniref:beta-galactosidase n=1 Tax=Kineococcus sp. SYSU DK005 TaxID=3383126 RepID=UPI003D7EC271
MLFGASYYHEYQPLPRLQRDLDLMVDAGFTVIRVGESTWSSYEPVSGRICFSALTAVVDAAHERGLKVVVGTPTYAVPPWLARQFPEIMVTPPDGQRLAYGGRQDVDFTHPSFLFHAERLIRAMAAAFAGHPGVIGFQVDNEIGVREIASAHVVERFRQHVMDELGGVQGVNDKWGLTFWSHRLSEPQDLWAPAGNSVPGYALQWQRFQAELTVQFLTWQRDLLREHLRPEQFVVHDLIGGHSAGSADVLGIARALDKTAVNIYSPLQRAVELPPPPEQVAARSGPDWMDSAGTWSMLWKADMAHSLRGPHGSRFLITEAQAGSIGWHDTNVPPWPGQLRLFAHLMNSRGADMLTYWHWHTLHYGRESYWGGVLGHDGEPGRIYEEVRRLGAELKSIAADVADAVPDADIAVLYSRDSLRALQADPALREPLTGAADPHSYSRVLNSWLKAATSTGTQVRIVHPDSDWHGQQVLVVPALYVADEALLQSITARARQGAHVVLTFRSGYADEWLRVRWTRAPGPLREAVGASYQEYCTLPEPIRLTVAATDPRPGAQDRPAQDLPAQDLPALELAEGASACAWADALVAESAQVLLGYDDPFLGGFAAVTTHAVGEGRITYVGCLLDDASTASLLRWALRERRQHPLASRWDAPEQVHVSSAVRADGRRLWTLTNHSWEATSVRTPFRGRVLTADDSSTAGDIGRAAELPLAPWGVAIVVEEAGAQA